MTEIRLYRDDEFASREMSTPLDRLKDNPTSLRGAIDAMCFQCIYSGGGGGGSWRQQVTDCTSDRCALWRVRPKSGREGLPGGTDGQASIENGAAGENAGTDLDEGPNAGKTPLAADSGVAP